MRRAISTCSRSVCGLARTVTCPLRFVRISIPAILLVVILFVVSGYASARSEIWKKVGKFFYKAAEAVCTLYTANEIITHALYGTDASGGWQHEARAEHFKDDPDFRAFTEMKQKQIYGNVLQEDRTRTYSPNGNRIVNWDHRFSADGSDIWAANAAWYEWLVERYIEDKNGGWKQDLDYGTITRSGDEYVAFDRPGYADMNEDGTLASAGLYIASGVIYKYKVGKWPLISKVHSDVARTWKIHQPTLDIAQENNLRYDARFYYDFRKLRWIRGTRSSAGYWQKQNHTETSVDWKGIKAWKETTKYIDGDKILKSGRIMTDWKKVVGRVSWRAHLESETKSVRAKRKPSLDTDDDLAEDVILEDIRVNEWDVDPETLERGSLDRPW